MNRAISKAGITFAACLTCAAVGYAAKESVEAVVIFTMVLSLVFSITAAASEAV